MDKQWKVVPVDRSYDMRVKALIAFNQAEGAGKDRDTALGEAFQAALEVSPQPPRTDDGRDLFDVYLESVGLRADRVGNDYKQLGAQCAWVGWQACMMMQNGAPQPPSASDEREWVAEVVWIDPVLHSGTEARKEIDCAVGWLEDAPLGTKLYAAPSPAASADEWMAEAERLAKQCNYGSHEALAALLAHLNANL